MVIENMRIHPRNYSFEKEEFSEEYEEPVVMVTQSQKVTDKMRTHHHSDE
jgi:hypothetical protein